MMKIIVSAPGNKYGSAHKEMYWLQLATFGEVAELYVKGGAEPWYCQTHLKNNLANWNNGIVDKPNRLVHLI